MLAVLNMLKANGAIGGNETHPDIDIRIDNVENTSENLPSPNTPDARPSNTKVHSL